MMRAYYNEIDPYAAQWIRNLIKAGHVTDGEVDERSIVDVVPADLRGFDRCHFFAGIAVWDYALGLAGWGDAPVWTGSCPCQPFSAAGKGGRFDDERHLWPAWHHLIRECRPATILGEQVAGKDGLDWLDLVHADLEGCGYAVGAGDFPAAGVGAPHIRQRLWFVADAAYVGRRESCSNAGRFSARDSAEGLPPGSMPSRPNGFWGRSEWIACRDGKKRPIEPGTQPLAHGSSNRLGPMRAAYGNAINAETAACFIGAVLEAR